MKNFVVILFLACMLTTASAASNHAAVPSTPTTNSAPIYHTAKSDTDNEQVLKARLKAYQYQVKLEKEATERQVRSAIKALKGAKKLAAIQDKIVAEQAKQ